jgi:hypothetical protein
MPAAFKSNQEFYNYVDTTIGSLRHAGFADDADRLQFLLHKVAWTTSSELFGELGHALLATAEKPLPPEVGVQVSSCIAGVELIWPNIRQHRAGR